MTAPAKPIRAPWNRLRNPDLLPSWKTGQLDRLYGHRIIYVAGRRCPHLAGRCTICERNTADTVGMHYRPAATAAFTTELVRSPDDGRTERLNHRWLTTAATATWTGVYGQTVTALEGVDFAIDNRDLLWLPGGTAPEKGDKYLVTYSAHVEDNISLQHVVTGLLGAHGQAETGRFLPAGYTEQGQIIASLPPESSCHDLQQGDLIVPVDAEMTFYQVIDLTANKLRARHKWVVEVMDAFFLEYTGEDPEANPDLVREVPITVSFDRANQLWVVTGPVPETCHRITVTYRAAPIYVVTDDLGEFRSPVQGKQARLVTLARTEIFL